MWSRWGVREGESVDFVADFAWEIEEGWFLAAAALGFGVAWAAGAGRGGHCDRVEVSLSISLSAILVDQDDSYLKSGRKTRSDNSMLSTRNFMRREQKRKERELERKSACGSLYFYIWQCGPADHKLNQYRMTTNSTTMGPPPRFPSIPLNLDYLGYRKRHVAVVVLSGSCSRLWMS